jgi:hypothetical protein
MLTLAPGIGANAAVGSLVHAVPLAPLPVANRERLVVVTVTISTKATSLPFR